MKETKIIGGRMDILSLEQMFCDHNQNHKILFKYIFHIYISVFCSLTDRQMDKIFMELIR